VSVLNRPVVAREIPWYPDWVIKAACRNLPRDIIDRLFFDYGRNKLRIQEAKRICATCPVIRKCYHDNREVPQGIFYGMTAIERWRERGLKGYPNSNVAYSYFAQFFGKSVNGIGPKGAQSSSIS
jgi:hypothetical protein